ncbi:hypothetical protein CIPAW_15G184700 [Carya illinoinensis]|uniref:Secreted protein n=1 Tax=Carya illinoinensis TaxID=32201 RepID=A0A8T1NH47_CARIL|nr:hypothetical protein CIPAW_15G184700 [Carya illinoinensis]
MLVHLRVLGWVGSLLSTLNLLPSMSKLFSRTCSSLSKRYSEADSEHLLNFTSQRGNEFGMCSKYLLGLISLS